MYDGNRGWRDGGLLVMAALLLLGLLAYPLTVALGEQTGYTPEEERLLQAYESGQMIRLHILADSDREEDQRVKLCVRDAVLEAFGRQLSRLGAADADSAYRYLCREARAMEQAARQEARRQGFLGTVTAEVGVLSLPEKQYGRVTLPAGDYRALRLTLGSGQGRNWWCILFPQLCLALASDEASPQAAVAWRTPRIWQNWLAWRPQMQ